MPQAARQSGQLDWDRLRVTTLDAGSFQVTVRQVDNTVVGTETVDVVREISAIVPQSELVLRVGAPEMRCFGAVRGGRPVLGVPFGYAVEGPLTVTTGEDSDCPTLTGLTAGTSILTVSGGGLIEDFVVVVES